MSCCEVVWLFGGNPAPGVGVLAAKLRSPGGLPSFGAGQRRGEPHPALHAVPNLTLDQWAELTDFGT